MSELCPCGSGRPLDECCGPYLEGKAWPDDADTMVRSRFSAYCLGKFDYLVETTHPAYREDLTAQMLEEQTRDVHWLRLDMGPCEKDQPEGENGELFDTAEFYAYYELEGSVRQIGERSFFQASCTMWTAWPVVPRPTVVPSPRWAVTIPVPAAAAKSTRSAAAGNRPRRGDPWPILALLPPSGNFVLNVRAIPPVPCASARMRTAPCGGGVWPPSRRTAARNGMAPMRRAALCASSAGSA